MHPLSLYVFFLYCSHCWLFRRYFLGRSAFFIICRKSEQYFSLSGRNNFVKYRTRGNVLIMPGFDQKGIPQFCFNMHLYTLSPSDQIELYCKVTYKSNMRLFCPFLSKCHQIPRNRFEIMNSLVKRDRFRLLELQISYAYVSHPFSSLTQINHRVNRSLSWKSGIEESSSIGSLEIWRSG